MAGGMCGRGHAWQGHVWQGAYMAGSVHAGETATEADGTHPTGMHSCNNCRIPKAIVQRHLKENNRNAATCSHFKTNCCLKIHNAHLNLASPVLGQVSWIY